MLKRISKKAMMLKTLACLVLVASLFGGVLSGCGSSEMDEDYLQSGAELGQERREIFLRAEGQFDAMTPEDRQRYLSGFNNDEEQARRFWEFMANPPTGDDRFRTNPQ